MQLTCRSTCSKYRILDLNSFSGLTANVYLKGRYIVSSLFWHGWSPFYK